MSPSPSTLQILGAILFAVALAHTFAASQFERLAHRFPRHRGLFHLLGEVEVVFGFWAIVLIGAMALIAGGDAALCYAESRNYTEPLFVFVVMVIAASRPILTTVSAIVGKLAHLAPLPTPLMTAWLGLFAVHLMGSLVTEPAAMTIAALMLAPVVFTAAMPPMHKYFALGVLFVNISIGGTLTSFAAPPILMVAHTWQWNSSFVFMQFGWKAALAVFINATLAATLMRRHVVAPPIEPGSERPPVPFAVAAIHIGLLAGVVAFAHHPVIFMGIFLTFLGFAQAYEHHQSRLIIREGLLVGFFLAGLVVLGGLQSWWLQPLVAGLEPMALFFGAVALTAITDNAALTYLGSLIPDIGDQAKYMLVAGAVAGGGLTVIANAPNPAGLALLKHGFSGGTVSALGLLAGAALPTLVAIGAFLVF